MEISEEWFASLTRFETDLIKTCLDINDPKKSDTMPEIDEPVKITRRQNLHHRDKVFL